PRAGSISAAVIVSPLNSASGSLAGPVWAPSGRLNASTNTMAKDRRITCARHTRLAAARSMLAISAIANCQIQIKLPHRSPVASATALLRLWPLLHVVCKTLHTDGGGAPRPPQTDCVPRDLPTAADLPRPCVPRD